MDSANIIKTIIQLYNYRNLFKLMLESYMYFGGLEGQRPYKKSYANMSGTSLCCLLEKACIQNRVWDAVLGNMQIPGGTLSEYRK